MPLTGGGSAGNGGRRLAHASATGSSPGGTGTVGYSGAPAGRSRLRAV